MIVLAIRKERTQQQRSSTERTEHMHVSTPVYVGQVGASTLDRGFTNQARL